MQEISRLPSNTASCQRPKPARIVPSVVIRIGSGTKAFVCRVASLNSVPHQRKWDSLRAGIKLHVVTKEMAEAHAKIVRLALPKAS